MLVGAGREKAHAKLHANKVKCQDEINNFLEKCKAPKLTPLKRGNRNRPVTTEKIQAVVKGH